MSSFRFLHVGDVHIGRERLGGALPSRDFSDAFDQVADAAIRARAAFVLVAGDFFDRSRIEPNHLTEAEPPLVRLRDAGIPVVAIEGNHDVVSSWDDRPSWLTYLNDAGLIRLLRTEFRDGEPMMREWTDRDRTGSWLDLGPARIYGAGWLGAATARRLEKLAPRLERGSFTILMLHAGVAGFTDEFGIISAKELEVIRPSVDYVALGHLHKRYVVGAYAYNPGAPEHWDLGEARYGDQKGYWLVDVDGRSFIPSHEPVRRRPVHLAALDCTSAAGGEEVVDLLLRAAEAWSLDPSTAVRIALTGQPTFDGAQLDRRALAEAVRARTRVFAVEVVPAFTRPAKSDPAAAAPRESIEREEILACVRELGRYEGLEETVADLVRAVVAARDDESLFAELLDRAAPLLKERHADPVGPAPERQVVR